MSESIKVVRIFIGSPGGLDDERRAAREVVDEVNLANSEYWGCQFNLVGWEDTIPGYQRPQDKINEDLDKCDYFLGVLWDRWGSRSSTTENGFTSGFHEEFCRARERVESGRMKDLTIYFKSVEIPTGMEPGEHIKKVLEFRQECIDEKKVYFKDFKSIENFRDLARRKLMDIGWRETEIVQTERQLETQSEQAPFLYDDAGGTDTGNTHLIDGEARKFIAEIQLRPPELSETKAHEIARFRLIASALSRPGNDELYLGNHDANLVFRRLRDSPISDQEVQALVNCGVAGFNNQNVPLWCWIARAEKDGDFFEQIRFLATVGNRKEKKNAIEILGLASQPIPSVDNYFDKKQTLKSWFSDKTENPIFDAAISFLSANADTDDVLLLEELSSNCSPQRLAKVEAAIVEVLSRSSVDAALKRIIEKNIDKVDEELVEKLFKSPQSLTTETVNLCLSAKVDSVRLHAVQLLYDRDEIAIEAAETLITDSNHEVRLLAAESLRRLGHSLGETLIKKALMIEKKSSNLVSLLGQSNETDATYYERYVANRLRELDFRTLKEKVKEAVVFDDLELSVLYSKFKSRTQDEIRVKLDDGFKGHFDAAVQRWEEVAGLSPERVSQIRKLEAFQRKRLCTDALNVLCSMRKVNDLPLVRKTVDDFEVEGTKGILDFLARFGDWSDIDRIKGLGDYPSDRATTLLGFVTTHLPQHKASAIFTLGKKRIADMLALDLDSTIRNSLVKQLPMKIFTDLSDEVLMRELNRDDDEYRIFFALRCAQSLSKSRITALMKQYVDSKGHRYYNSIHWLDLRASLPLRLVKTIVENKLSHY